MPLQPFCRNRVHPTTDIVREDNMEEKTILVIEDNAYNMKLARSLIKIGGYSILEAGSAEEGLELAKKNEPDLILMDIQLPGMDGLTATSEIKKNEALKDIPVLALTAYAMKGDEQRVLDVGCSGYITKPIDTKKFLRKLKEYLPGESPGLKMGGSLPNKNSEPTNVDERAFYKKKILIVDDEPLNVKLLKAKLTCDKFLTMEAYSGHECLELVEKELPDIILLDLMMPGIDGFDVTKILKNDDRTKSIPVIHITALDSSKDKAKALKVGADEFLNKPINTKELLTRIRTLLRIKKYQEQLSTRKKSEAHFIFKQPETDVNPDDVRPKATILIADTNQSDVNFLKKNLDTYCSRLFVTESGSEAVHIAETEKIDIVLLDIPLSDMDGHEVCKRLKKMDRTRNIQVITVTSRVDIKTKIKSIELGTDDYLVKPVNPLELQARIRSSIKKKTYMDILVSKYETAFNTSITDQLTGLYNNAFFRHYIGLELNRCIEQNHFLTLLMIDIDNFKNINDTYGHQLGDVVLRRVADVLRASVREIDVCARYGGEEFTVVLPYADKPSGVSIAERVRKSISKIQDDFGHPGGIGRVTVSIGVAICPPDALTVTELVHRADMAMYEAKRGGKNRISCAVAKPSSG